MKNFAIIFAIISLLSLILFWPIFLGKVNLNSTLLVTFYPIFNENLPFKASGLDQLRIYFPFYNFAFGEMKIFILPLWSQYIFAGHPYIANFQSAVFYPLNIFGLLLPQIEFWHLMRITPILLGSIFMFLYLKNLKLNTFAVVFGAITFGFSPFILTWGEDQIITPHSIIWLPLILFSVDSYIKSKKKIFIALIAFAVSFTIFSGFPQLSLYALILGFLYLSVRILQENNRLKYFFIFTGSYVLGILISAIQLLPSIELYLNSARSQMSITSTLEQFLLPGYWLVTLFSPDFFGNPATRNFFSSSSAQYYESIIFFGIAALIFSLYTFIVLRRNKMIIFWVLLFILPFILIFDWQISKLFLKLPIPILGSSITNRVIFLIPLSASILSAYGVDKWLKVKDKKILLPLLSIGVIFFSIYLYLFIVKSFNLHYFNDKTPIVSQPVIASLRNMVIPTFIYLIIAALITFATFVKRYRKLVVIFVICISYLHIFYFGQKYFSFSERRYVFPENNVLKFIKNNQGIYRIWGVGDGYLENNFASFYKINWPEGYSSLNDKSYAEFTFLMQGENFENFQRLGFRADAGLGRGTADELIANGSRRKLIDLMGIKYVIASQDDKQLLEDNKFKSIEGLDGKFTVFENLQVLPRAYLVSNWEGPPSYYEENKTLKEIDKIRRKLIFDKLLSPNFDFKNTVILEKPSPISPQAGEGKVDILNYKNSEVIIRTKADQPKLLYLSDNWYPGWKATVDGDEVEIMRANYTFRAVPLVAGEHIVRFYYDSQSFKTGALISSIAIVILLFFTLKQSRRKG